ncbi:methylmalonyl-CoA mutase, partial [Chloroflexota bacterium]
AELLKDKGLKDVLVIGGGIIPQIDTAELKSKGVAEVFGPGSRIADIARFIRENIGTNPRE